MSDTPQKTNPHNIVATVEETQKMTLNTSKTKHFANTICEYYGAAEPPVRCGESHLSGLTEPPHFVY